LISVLISIRLEQYCSDGFSLMQVSLMRTLCHPMQLHQCTSLRPLR